MRRLTINSCSDKPQNADNKYLIAAGKNFYTKEKNKKHPLPRVQF